MIMITTKKFIGKGKYDKVFHLIDNSDGLMKRVCCWLPIRDSIIIGKEVTCENCKVRQYDNDWEGPCSHHQ